MTQPKVDQWPRSGVEALNQEIGVRLRHQEIGVRLRRLSAGKATAQDVSEACRLIRERAARMMPGIFRRQRIKPPRLMALLGLDVGFAAVGVPRVLLDSSLQAWSSYNPTPRPPAPPRSSGSLSNGSARTCYSADRPGYLSRSPHYAVLKGIPLDAIFCKILRGLYRTCDDACLARSECTATGSACLKGVAWNRQTSVA
jgi:hypothetical protein